MTPKPSFALEQASPEEASKYFYEWPNSELWNPSRGSYEVAQVHMKVDPSAFWVGKVTDNESQQKTTVSIISAIHYGDKQGWIGYNICDSAYRGRGYGLQGFTDALGKFAPGASVGLDSVMAQVDNYKKSGFVHHAWTNERRHGAIADLIAKIAIDEQKHTGRLVEASKLTSLQEQFGQLDKEATGLDRPEFAARWLAFHNGEEHRFNVVYLSEDHKTVLGYGAARPAVSTYRVGPLYATTDEIANVILVELARRVLEAHKTNPLEGVQPVFDIDVPDKNKAATALFDRLGWPNIFPCARLWAGHGIPEANVDHLYAVCTLEVG